MNRSQVTNSGEIRRERSKSDPSTRDESFTAPHYMTTSSNAELKGVPALQIQSDLNVHGGEYRPRTVSNPIRARPPVASFPKTAQATRHARRLYFGGFSPSTEEDALKHFLNEVISAGLNEGNDDSYILSIYLNQKKCFAFVELKSIELTTACLFLDGVVMDGLPLKVQRANEYKPELVPAVKSVVELDLSKIQFYDGQSPLPKNNTYNTGDAFSRDRMTIPHVDLSMLKLGDIVLVGIKIGSEEATDSNIPNARRVIKNYLYSVRTSNPEYAVDISDINVVDVGDVQLTMEDIDSDGGKMAVQNMIASIVHAGGYPVLLGAPGSSKGKASSPFSCDDNYLHASICGVLSSFSDPTSYMGGGVAGIPSVALLSASARIRKVCHLLLSDTAFSRNSHNIDSCDGRLRSFGVQGSHCTVEDTRSMLTSGGVLTWLTRDIRGADKKHSNSHGNLLPFKKNNTNSANLLFTTTGILFQEVMQELSARKDLLSKSSTSAMGSQKSVVVSLHPDASMYAAAATSACPLGSRCGACSDISSQGGEGFSPVEWFDVALVTGQYKNVVALDLSGWSGVLGCPRLPSMLLGNIFYHFLIGVALSRVQAAGGLPYKCFTTDKVQHNDAHGVSPSAGRSIFEAFKYYTTDNRKSVTEDGIFSDDRQSSLSDSPAHLEAPIRISSREPRKEKSKFLSRGYPSMGLSLSSDGSAESTRTTLGHGLFTDSLGSIIARTALSILESPMGSRSTDTDSNAASLDAPKE